MSKKLHSVLDDNIASGVIDPDSADIIRNYMGAQIKEYEALERETTYNPAWGKMEIAKGKE